MFIKSLRWRLQLWLAFLLVCILSGFGVTAYQLHRTNRLNQIDDELRRRLAAISSEVRAPPFGKPLGGPRMEPGPGRRKPFPGEPLREPDPLLPVPPPLFAPKFKERHDHFDEFLAKREIQLSSRTLNLFDASETNGFYFAIWSRNGSLLKQSTNAPAELPWPERATAGIGIRLRMRDDLREMYQFTEIGECVLSGRSIAADQIVWRRFGWWLLAAGGAVLGVGLGGGWLLVGRATRPIDSISAAANRISAGNLSERISVEETETELGRLAGVLNSTFARLEAAFAQQKQFTADASHELRTPLAVLISEAQSTLARERGAPEYRQAIQVCLEAAQQMRRLTQSLLELARFDAGQQSLERQPFDLSEVARACVETIRPLAKERNLQFVCDLQPAGVLGDADRLSQVVTNLLVNAIYYNKDGGEIRVRTRHESHAAVFTVADTGIGIAAEDQARIFERFYRVDKSRARAHGRSGLGLSICKAIVEAHGGSIIVSSQLGLGTEFTVQLPEVDHHQGTETQPNAY